MRENSNYFAEGNRLTVLERYAANVALSHAKCSYEFMVSYQVDELIIPRIFLTTFFQTIALLPRNADAGCRVDPSNIKTQFNLNYDIYKYAKGLQREHGTNNAYFYFTNHQLINNGDNLFAEINQAISAKKKSLDYNNSATNTYYRYLIKTESDTHYLSQMIAIRSHIDCINATYFKSLIRAQRLDARYTRYFASLNYNNHPGKSIFDTQLTEGVDQHTAVKKKPFSRFYEVPPSIGYLSHFTNKDQSSQYMFFAKCPILYEYEMHDLKIDLEYLYLLLSLIDRL